MVGSFQAASGIGVEEGEPASVSILGGKVRGVVPHPAEERRAAREIEGLTTTGGER